MINEDMNQRLIFDNSEEFVIGPRGPFVPARRLIKTFKSGFLFFNPTVDLTTVSGGQSIVERVLMDPENKRI